jgi:high-affinity iron transporter
MLQAFIIVLREGFEAFLIVAIILAYLKRNSAKPLFGAVYWGIAASAFTSAGLGYLLREGVNEALWEGALGVATILMVGTLIIQMWRTGHKLKADMENTLSRVSSRPSQAAFLGVFLFTVLMITREGMETVVMLLQVREPRFVSGAFLGLAAAAALSYGWVRVSHLINLKRFFQVTGVFLLLFLVQIAIYSVHEFSEAGVLPNSEAIHIATERFSPVGLYGKWFSLSIVVISAGWLAASWMIDKLAAGRSAPPKTLSRN